MKFLHWIKEELLQVLPAVIYFVIAFNLIQFTESLALRHFNIHYLDYLTVTIAALFVGKVLILINALPFINLFPHKPLIYNILWKFFIYNFFMLFFRVLEGIVRLYFEMGSISLAIDQEKLRLISLIFWSIQMWFVLVFFVYVVFSEFVRVLGKKQVLQLLFYKSL